MKKKAWVFFSQLFILIAIYHLGNLVAGLLNLKVPGNVIGMMILLALLWLKVIKVEQIEYAANWLLKHLGFFFIPISVGLMTLGEMVMKNGVALLFILILSAFTGLIVTGKITQSVMKRKDVKMNADNHSI